MQLYEQLGLPSNVVYVKQIDPNELPLEVRNQVEEGSELFAVHCENGEQVALFTDKNLAFSLAREYSFDAHSVH
ncbi:MAG: DUF1150 family protein [Pseudomonadota bacterium]